MEKQQNIERTGFLFYRSWALYINNPKVSDKSKVKFIQKLINFALDSDESIILDEHGAMVFENIKPVIQKQLTNSSNGAKPKTKWKRNRNELETKQERNGNETISTSTSTSTSTYTSNDIEPTPPKRDIPKKDKSQLFRDSIYFDKNKLKQKLKWSDDKIDHYYESMFLYSESKGAKYVDWSATAKSWERKDEREGKSYKEKSTGNSKMIFPPLAEGVTV